MVRSSAVVEERFVGIWSSFWIWKQSLINLHDDSDGEVSLGKLDEELVYVPPRDRRTPIWIRDYLDDL